MVKTFSIAPKSTPAPFPGMGYCLNKRTAPSLWHGPVQNTLLLHPHQPQHKPGAVLLNTGKDPFFCVFHGACAPLSPPRAGLLCQHPCFTPRLLPNRVSPPLSPCLLVPFVFLTQHFLLGSWFQYFMLNLFLFPSFACPYATPYSLTSPLGYTFFGAKLLC